MSSKIIPVIQSFQSKLRLFESLKHTGIGSWAEVVTLLLVHSPAGEFIWCPDPFYDIWPGHSGSGCGYCQPGDNVLPMLPRSLRRHQRERELGNGECQWDNCVTTQGSARPSDSEETRPEVTSEEFKFIHTSYLQPRLQEVLHSHLFSQVKFNFTWDVSRHLEMWVTAHCHRRPELTSSGQDTLDSGQHDLWRCLYSVWRDQDKMVSTLTTRNSEQLLTKIGSITLSLKTLALRQISKAQIMSLISMTYHSTLSLELYCLPHYCHRVLPGIAGLRVTHWLRLAVRARLRLRCECRRTEQWWPGARCAVCGSGARHNHPQAFKAVLHHRPGRAPHTAWSLPSHSHHMWPLTSWDNL